METGIQTFLEEQAVALEKVRQEKYKAFVRHKNTIGILIKILKVLLVASLVACIIFPFAFIATIVLFLVYSYLSGVSNPKDEYISHFKEEVLPDVFKRVHPSFEYQAYSEKSDNLHKSGLLKSSLLKGKSKIVGEDFITGKIEGVDIECSEYHFYRKEKNWVKFFFLFISAFIVYPFLFIYCIVNEMEFERVGWLSLANRETLFYRGFLMTADFHKTFKGNLIMLPKHHHKTADLLNMNVDTRRYKKIELENPKINELFQVYTTSEQEGFYILSPKMLADIEELCESNKASTPTISFLEGRMHMFIPKTHDSFEVDIHKKIFNASFFSSNINDIMVLPRLVEHFNLEHLLWSK